MCVRGAVRATPAARVRAAYHQPLGDIATRARARGAQVENMQRPTHVHNQLPLF